MDLSLKQRLLGAIVLIALAVIFVPMILSGPAPQQGSETVNLAIPPAPNREFQNRVLPVDPAQPQAATQNPPTAASDQVVSHDALATLDTPPRAPEIAQPTEPVATPAGDAKADISTPPKPDTTKPTKADAATTKADIAKAESAPGRAASGRFYVHLGIYASAKNADDLVAMLKKSGYPAFAEASTYQGKAGERVRVGPFEDRAAAEAARLRIRQVKADVPASVVQLADDAKADAPPAALPADRAGGWAVQLGAFKTVDEANKVRDRLKTAGFVAFVDRATTDNGTLFRVRAGPETDRGNADKLRGRIKDKLKLDGMIVTQQ
jgi:DedD protein